MPHGLSTVFDAYLPERGGHPGAARRVAVPVAPGASLVARVLIHLAQQLRERGMPARLESSDPRLAALLFGTEAAGDPAVRFEVGGDASSLATLRIVEDPADAPPASARGTGPGPPEALLALSLRSDFAWECCSTGITWLGGIRRQEALRAALGGSSAELAAVAARLTDWINALPDPSEARAHRPPGVPPVGPECPG